MQIPFARDAAKARSALESERDAVATEREELLGRVMREHPRWASARVPLPFDAARDLAALPATWYALSAFWFGSELHLFLTRPGEPLIHRADQWSLEERRDLQASQQRLRSATTAQLYTAPVIPERFAARLLPREILQVLNPGDALLVSPHGELRGVPLHILAGPGRAVQYIPSLTLLGLARPDRAAPDVLLLGCERDGFDNPRLPGVARELDAAAEAWARPPATRTTSAILGAGERLGAGAPTPEAWAPYRVIVLACHGRLDPERPLEGALLLGRSALRMSELFALRLGADFVLPVRVRSRTARRPDRWCPRGGRRVAWVHDAAALRRCPLDSREPLESTRRYDGAPHASPARGAPRRPFARVRVARCPSNRRRGLGGVLEQLVPRRLPADSNVARNQGDVARNPGRKRNE